MILSGCVPSPPEPFSDQSGQFLVTRLRPDSIPVIPAPWTVEVRDVYLTRDPVLFDSLEQINLSTLAYTCLQPILQGAYVHVSCMQSCWQCLVALSRLVFFSVFWLCLFHPLLSIRVVSSPKPSIFPQKFHLHPSPCMYPSRNNIQSEAYLFLHTQGIASQQIL